MRKIMFLLALSSCSFFTNNIEAAADDIGLSSEYSVCIEKSDGVTANMLECIASETKQQETRLNMIYKVLLAQMDAARQKELKNAQDLWKKFRVANVSFYDDPNGGTAARLSRADRFLIMTAERASELEKFKDD
jgi:uncharacterized protein YecT (DUF1311 family)